MAKHPTTCRTTIPLTTKNYGAKNVSSAKVEKRFFSWRIQRRLEGSNAELGLKI